MKRLLSVTAVVLAVAAIRRDRPNHAQRRHRRRPEHGRLRQQLPRAEVRGDEPGRQGARGRHRPRGRRLAEDLRKTLRAAEGGHRRVGHRRRGRPPARRGNDGQREAADAVSQRRRGRQARLARHGEECARRERRRLRAADVPLPDRVRVQPRRREGAAEVVCGARRVGEEEPEAVRLQRRQGRYVGRRFRDGLGLREQRPRREAREGTVFGRRQGDDRQVAREPQGLQPVRRDDAGQRRDARPAESRARSRWGRCGSTCSTPGRQTAR